MPFIQYVQDPSNPNRWYAVGDPAYVWTDDDLNAIMHDSLDDCMNPLTGLSVLGTNPSTVYGIWNDRFVPIINKLQWLKNNQDTLGGRGYLTTKIYNATGAMSPADCGKSVQIAANDISTGGGADVVLTLPTRAAMMAAGSDVLTAVTGAPYVNSAGGTLKPILINGYTATSGAPLAVTVATPTTSGSDLAQSINVPGLRGYDTLYLYSGEYAELTPTIIAVTSGSPPVTQYVLVWNVTLHLSGYGRVGEYAINPAGVLPAGQLKADNSSKTRAVYPRLWQLLNDSTSALNGALVAQGSKTNATYGDGNGTSTFTLPDLTSINATLVQYNIIY